MLVEAGGSWESSPHLEGHRFPTSRLRAWQLHIPLSPGTDSLQQLTRLFLCDPPLPLLRKSEKSMAVSGSGTMPEREPQARLGGSMSNLIDFFMVGSCFIKDKAIGGYQS